MNKEQKAQAYDKALEIARQYYEKGSMNAFLDTIFSELAESEDERIRKFLVGFFASYKIGDVATKLNGVRIDDILAYLEKQKDLDKMIVVSPEVWDNAITDAYENGKRDSEKQKEQKPAEDKELLKNILFQKKGITYDDYKCKNDPYVGLSFYELIKCLEEYDKARSNR